MLLNCGAVCDCGKPELAELAGLRGLIEQQEVKNMKEQLHVVECSDFYFGSGCEMSQTHEQTDNRQKLDQHSDSCVWKLLCQSCGWWRCSACVLDYLSWLAWIVSSVRGKKVGICFGRSRSPSLQTSFHHRGAKSDFLGHRFWESVSFLSFSAEQRKGRCAQADDDRVLKLQAHDSA